jgi:hypothetical protein
LRGAGGTHRGCENAHESDSRDAINRACVHAVSQAVMMLRLVGVDVEVMPTRLV